MTNEFVEALIQSKNKNFSVSFVYVKVLQPTKPDGLCTAQSVYLTTLLLDRLSPYVVNQYCAHSFARN